VPVLPGDDVAALEARVLKEEHRIYPQALDELGRSVRAASEHAGPVSAPRPRSRLAGKP
jgi:folate-dependent phosphoribosylglycinamide formyltransferase PurN